MTQNSHTFSAGSLTFRFDSDTGSVRNICFKGHEVLRGIYSAVRDRDWATLKPIVQPVRIRSSPTFIHLSASARVVGTEVDLAWTAGIEADDTGRLSYRWRAKAASACATNRTGLCVLHPAEVASAPCLVEHTDGSSEAGWFPNEISPHQPFQNIRAITHVVGRAEVMVRMQGEVFEMEDQRNWTDASFKTYGRPLALPRPYRLAPGEEIEQVITVEVRGDLEFKEIERLDAPGNSRSPCKLPDVGFTLPGPIPPVLRERLRALRPAHVRVETTPENLLATLDWARPEAEFLNCALMVAIRGAETQAPDRLRFPSCCSVHLFDAEGNFANAETLSAWHHAGFGGIGTGTMNHFTELNRNRPPVNGDHNSTVFGINAQVHANDDDSILETLTQHEMVARTAYRIGGGRPVVIAPISLGRSANSVDPRLVSECGADWLMESLAQLAKAKCVESATYFHAHGPAGFLRAKEVTPVERLLLTLAGKQMLPDNLHICS